MPRRPVRVPAPRPSFAGIPVIRQRNSPLNSRRTRREKAATNCHLWQPSLVAGMEHKGYYCKDLL